MSARLQVPDKVGPLFFCPNCGNLLDVPSDEDVIKCPPCGADLDAGVYDNLTLLTRSNPTAFPSALRLKRQLVTTVSSSDDNGGANSEATIKEKCPKCGWEEMKFSTLQMRSADEGTTVFYTCLNMKCGYKFSQNN